MAFDPDLYLEFKKKKPVQSGFDPDAYIQNNSSPQNPLAGEYAPENQNGQSQTYSTLESNDPALPQGMTWDDIKSELKTQGLGYLGGASIPYVSPALSSVLETTIDQFRGTGSKKGLLQTLKNNYNYADTKFNEWKEDAPIAATIGQIPRDALLYTTGAKYLEKAPLIGKGAAKLAENSGKFAQYGRKGVELAKDLNRSALLTTAITQLDNPDTDRLLQDYLTSMGLDASVRGVVTGLRAGGSTIYNLFKNPRRNQDVLETLPIYKQVKQGARRDAIDAFKAGEAQRKAQHESGIYEMMSQFEDQEAARRAAHQLEKNNAVEGFKDLIEKDPLTAAGSLESTLGNESKKLSQAYKKAIDPLMKKHGDTPVDLSQLQAQVDDLLREYNILDDVGAVRKEAIEGLISPEVKDQVNTLLNVRDRISGNNVSNTLKGTNALRKELSDKAKYSMGEGFRGGKEKVFGSLANKSKSLMESTFQNLPEEEIADFLTARKNYAKKGIIREAQKTFKLPQERLAVNLRSKLPASKMEELIDSFPEVRDDLANLFLNNLTHSSVSPRKFTKEIDYYGRDFLKKLLGPEKFSMLEAAEGRLTKAALPFQKSVAPTPIPFKPGDINALSANKPSIIANAMARAGNFFDPARRLTQNSEFVPIFNSSVRPAMDSVIQKLMSLYGVGGN